jgi:anti-sigma factor RsiW
MECRDCTDALSALIDGELSGGEHREVDSHLSVCSLCKEEYDSLVVLSKLTERMSQLEVNPALWEQVRAQTDVPSSSQSMSSIDRLRSLLTRPWLPLAAGAAAAVLFVVLNSPFSEDKSALERELDAFMQVREQIAERNAEILFGASGKDRDYRAGNPFLQRVNYVKENPFRE